MGVAVGAAVTPQQLTASLSAVDPESGERLGRRYTPGGTYVDNLGRDPPEAQVLRLRHGVRPAEVGQRSVGAGRPDDPQGGRGGVGS